MSIQFALWVFFVFSSASSSRWIHWTHWTSSFSSYAATQCLEDNHNPRSSKQQVSSQDPCPNTSKDPFCSWFSARSLNNIKLMMLIIVIASPKLCSWNIWICMNKSIIVKTLLNSASIWRALRTISSKSVNPKAHIWQNCPKEPKQSPTLTWTALGIYTPMTHDSHHGNVSNCRWQPSFIQLHPASMFNFIAFLMISSPIWNCSVHQCSSCDFYIAATSPATVFYFSRVHYHGHPWPKHAKHSSFGWASSNWIAGLHHHGTSVFFWPRRARSETIKNRLAGSNCKWCICNNSKSLEVIWNHLELLLPSQFIYARRQSTNVNLLVEGSRGLDSRLGVGKSCRGCAIVCVAVFACFVMILDWLLNNIKKAPAQVPCWKGS